MRAQDPGLVTTLAGPKASLDLGLLSQAAWAHLQIQMPKPKKWRGRPQPQKGPLPELLVFCTSSRKPSLCAP